jgi:hypothetical protein
MSKFNKDLTEDLNALAGHIDAVLEHGWPEDKDSDHLRNARERVRNETYRQLDEDTKKEEGNNMTITRNGKDITLTDEEVESIYKQVHFEKTEEDIKLFCGFFNEQKSRNIKFEEKDYQVITQSYLDYADGTLPENEEYQEYIETYVNETFNDDDSRKEE